MLPKISGYGLSSESSFSIVCPHCKQVNEIKVARFIVAVSRSEAFGCVACSGKFTVEIVPQPSGNLTPDAADGGDSLLFDGSQSMDCGHEAKYIVFSERRNYCGICGKDAHPFNSWFRSTRRR